ncbi:unnamed protein product [Durusdinium trenchii]
MQLAVRESFQHLLVPYGFKGGLFQAELLDVCEFDNLRKRMSVVIRLPTDEILLYVKGADSSILPYVLEQELKDLCVSDLLTFARRGLRTLCLAERSLSNEEFQAWHQRFQEAKALITEDRADRIHELSNELETNRPLKLLGATAIDDKLQDEVPETIEQLRTAGIRVWVLTGDKVDTAISIAMSCKLLTDEMNNFIIDSDTEQKLPEILRDVLEAEDPALTIEGSMLAEVMEDRLTRSLLFHAGQRCRSVVCCRVSPKQKADVVDLVKTMDQTAVTLSIGDGANDVSMIVAAHVGIGLCGKEGAQAAQSGDFALPEFRLLRRAVFAHGKEDYRRLSMVCIYTFYKNQVNVLITILSCAVNAFSGANVVNPWLMQCYNLLHCHLPIFIYGILDRAGDPDVLELDPSGHSPHLFGMDVEFLWMGKAVLQALVIIVAWYSTTAGIAGDGGPDLSQTSLVGNLCFISVVLCVNVTLILRQHSWPRLIILCYASNAFFLVLTIIVCVRGISQVAPNWIRVSLTTIVVLALTTIVGEVVLSFGDLFFGDEEGAAPVPSPRPAPAEPEPTALEKRKAPKWNQRFNCGINVNDSRPQGLREYFSRPQSMVELKRFWEAHVGSSFKKHLEAHYTPPRSAPPCKLFPSSLSSLGGSPVMLPERHSPGGSMKDLLSGEIVAWHDYWSPPARYRRPFHKQDRPLLPFETFGDVKDATKIDSSPATLRRHDRELEARVRRRNKLGGPQRKCWLEPEPW